MYNLDLKPRAIDTLQGLEKTSKKDHDSILDSLTELELVGLSHSQSRRLFGNNPVIYRMRVGRWRCVFTIDQRTEINVWIIDIEKDTKKDYDRWITYIKSQY